MKNKTQKLLSIGSDSKTIKGNKYHYSTAILYLASAKQSGFNVCPSASNQCIEDCLFWSGRGRMKNTQNARIKKTQHYFLDRKKFMHQLKHEIELFIKRSIKNNVNPCVRLNGTSDISFEIFKYKNGLNIFDNFPDLQFYDYTSEYKRMSKYMNNKLPKNYHLTFSSKEDNQKHVSSVLKNGFNVSVVFEKNLPLFYKGCSVINGDESDLRFLDDRLYDNHRKNIVDLKTLMNNRINSIRGCIVKPDNRLPKIIGLKYKKSKGNNITIGKNSFIIKQGK